MSAGSLAALIVIFTIFALATIIATVMQILFEKGKLKKRKPLSEYEAKEDIFYFVEKHIKEEISKDFSFTSKK